MSGFTFTLFQVLPDGELFELARGTLSFCVKEQRAYINKGYLANNLTIEENK